MKKIFIATMSLMVAFLACGTLRATEHYVDDVDELVAAINVADNDDVIILRGAGPYDLNGLGLTAITKNITIKSSDGTPRIICDSTPGRTDKSLLTTANVIWENIQLGDVGTTRVVTQSVIAAEQLPPDYDIPTTDPVPGGTLGIDGAGGETVTFDSMTFQKNGLNVTNQATFGANMNVATYGAIQGAAIHCDGADLVFNGPTAFNDNSIKAVVDSTVTFNAPGTRVYLLTGKVSGAGLYTNGGNVTFSDDAVFSGNTIEIKHNVAGEGIDTRYNLNYDAGTGAGSAIHNDGSALVFQGDATFANNTIAESSSYSNIAFMPQNLRTGSGGALYNTFGTTTFKGKSRFEGNRVATGNTANGGAVFLQGGVINFDDTATFKKNTVSGGMIWSAGGAVFVGENRYDTGEYVNGILNFNAESFFTENLVAGLSGHGGAVCTDLFGTTNFYAHAFFDQNKAAFGGALGSSHSTAVTNFYSTALFDGNTATDGGGAVGFYDLGGTVNFYDFTQFTKNTADNRGGAIDISSSNGSFTGTVNFYGVSEFENNKAVNDGGAMRIGKRGTANFNNSAVFRNNEADNFGGAVYMDGGVMNVNLENPGENLLFELNTDTGGLSNAIHMTADSVINFSHVMGTDVYFNDNPITGDAGSINMYKCGTVHINGGQSDFKGDTIIYKGYWQLENGAEFGVSGSGDFFVDREGALSGGGGLYGSEIDLCGTILPGFYIDKGDYAYASGTLTFNDMAKFKGVSRYMPALWADGSSAMAAGSVTVEPGATIYLNFRPGDYSAGQQTYTTIASGNFAVEKAGFIDAGYDDATGEITLNGLNTNYFASHAGEKNQAFAERFDTMLADPNVSDVWWDRLSGMSLAIENGADADGIFNSLTGAQRANTIGMGLMTPKELAFRHIGREAVGCYTQAV